MNATETRRQLFLSRKESGVGVLLLDCPGKLNSLGTATMNELQQALQAIAADDAIKAVVMMSGKPDTFVIGADLYEIRRASTCEELLKMSRDGQMTLEMVAQSKKPMVIAINGMCLGGGLELAMAAHYRIASDAPITQLGLPETRLGIIPGLGGTQRLARIAGLKSALSMILSADPISVEEARNIGLVDEVVPAAELMQRAEAKALSMVSPDYVPPELKQSGWPLPDVDEEKANKLFAMTERSMRIKTKGNYPAQMRVIDVIKTGITQGMQAGLQLEADTFAELAGSDVATNLIGLFFQTDFAKQSAAGLAAKFGEADTHTVGIVGGGMMGSSISQTSGQHDVKAMLLVKAGKAAQTCDRIRSDKVECVEEYSRLADCQLVVESVTEILDTKQSVLKAVEASVSPDCTIASNTSSLPLSEISSVLQKNDRFVGLHFFHPVDKMPLVEIVSLKTTSRKAVARAADYVLRLGKIPLMVKDGPGFLIDRLLTCYLLDAARMVEQHIPLNWIEDAAIEFGLPMGPFEVLDEVGLDLAFLVADSLHKELGARMQPPPILINIPKLGLAGKKKGNGVFIYDDNGRRKEVNPQVASISEIVVSPDKADEATRRQIIERLLFPMIDEAARCLEDRIVMKPREIDMAVVYGIGFPPFRGGLLRYADSIGLPALAKRLQEIYAQTGGTREVSASITRYVAEGRGFYSRGGKEEE